MASRKDNVIDTLNDLIKTTDSDRQRNKRARQMSIGWRPGDIKPKDMPPPLRRSQGTIQSKPVSGGKIPGNVAPRYTSVDADEADAKIKNLTTIELSGRRLA